MLLLYYYTKTGSIQVVFPYVQNESATSVPAIQNNNPPSLRTQSFCFYRIYYRFKFNIDIGSLVVSR